MIAGGLDLQNAGAIGMTHYLPVEVGEHKGVLRMLEHCIDSTYPIAGALGVDLCQHRFQLDAPQHCFLVGDIVRLLTPSFLQP
ncbi:hypothetical protein D3C80_1975300 [compost metagenome]